MKYATVFVLTNTSKYTYVAIIFFLGWSLLTMRTASRCWTCWRTLKPWKKTLRPFSATQMIRTARITPEVSKTVNITVEMRLKKMVFCNSASTIFSKGTIFASLTCCTVKISSSSPDRPVILNYTPFVSFSQSFMKQKLYKKWQGGYIYGRSTVSLI